jgi:phosphotransferase system HPr-like phosphotransfer protein
MSKKITLQNQPGLPPWALTQLLLLIRPFRCQVQIHDGRVNIDGKKLLEVFSVIRSDLASVEVQLQGMDEEDALQSILNSKLGRFVGRQN